MVQNYGCTIIVSCTDNTTKKTNEVEQNQSQEHIQTDEVKTLIFTLRETQMTRMQNQEM